MHVVRRDARLYDSDVETISCIIEDLTQLFPYEWFGEHFITAFGAPLGVVDIVANVVAAADKFV